MRIGMAIITTGFFLGAPAVLAHLVAGSLVPKGGQTFRPGESVTITWGVEVPHKEGIALALSVDGGRMWTTIVANLPDEGKTGAFRWTVPATPTNQARLRICQTEKSPTCKDADSVPRASGPAPYVLVSGLFAIQASAALVPPTPPATAAPARRPYQGHDLRGRRADKRPF